MNKAFVREPDDTGELHCPACGSLGVAVQRVTWEAHLLPGATEGLADSAFFCPFPRCDVVYFDMFERRVTTAGLAQGVYPKDPSAPICGCFGLTIDDVEADIREGVVIRVRDVLDKAKSDAARCLTMSASGQCCTAEVQRAYMKLRNREASG